MNINPTRLFRRSLSLATLALISLHLPSPALAVINDNATQQIWKLKYGVTAVQLADLSWLDQDADNDGVKNGDEIAAGTNPFSGSKVIKVTSIVKNGSMVDIQFPTETGKRYQVESTATIATSNSWVLQPQPTPVQVVGNGGTRTLSVSYAANTFYRVRVGDLDTDGDGVADWAEMAVSLNPNAVQTVTGTNDLTYVNQQIALPNEVTITAATPFASEDGPSSGRITVSRKQNLFPLTVNLNVTGTAVPNTLPSPDYMALPGSIAFAARGATSSDLFVVPIQIAAPAIKGGRSVNAQVMPPASTDFPFTVVGPDNATVIINPSTAASGTGLLARYYDTSSFTAIDAANFGQAGAYAFTRSASPTTNGSVVVTYTGSTIPGLVAGNQVKLSFTTGNGNLNNSTFNNFNYPVTAVTASSFTVALTSATSFGGIAATNGFCNFSIQAFLHPPTITRMDESVNFDWANGTPNSNTILPSNSPTNYCASWETYLQPSVVGAYTFQLDADDKAQVLIDLNNDGDFLDAGEQVVEHNWNSPGSDSVGTFKLSAPVNLAVPGTPSARYRMRVEHVETTGEARCRLQWRVPGTTTFANIPQANQFSHTQALTYSYLGGGNLVVIPTGGHTYSVGNTVPLSFSSGILFTPGISNTFNGTYTITAVGGTSAPVVIAGAVTTLNSNTITVSSTAGLAVGMAVSGTGIPANQFITAIGAGSITVTTGSGVTAQASTTLTFTSNFTVAIAPTSQVAFTGATTNASNTITVLPSTAGLGLVLGMTVTGTGLPANEFITAIGATTITVTTGTGVTAQPSTNLTATLHGFSVPITGAATTAGNMNIIVPSLNGLANGMAISGAGLPANQFISGNLPGTGTLPGIISVSLGTGVTTQANTTLTATLPALGTGSGFIQNVPTSTTTGLYNLCYANTTSLNVGGPTISPGRVGIDTAVTVQNNGIWGSGSPDPALIQPDTFSARWTGQVQPQFSEDYTFTVTADDGCTLTLNGQTQVLRVLPSALTGTGAYLYDSATGNLDVNYFSLVATPGNFLVGETVRIDPTSGNLNHAPTTSPTYDYIPSTGALVVDYSNLVTLASTGSNRTAGSYTVGESAEVDPTSGSLTNLGNLPYPITAVAGNTFTVNVGALNFIPTTGISSISTAAACEITAARNHNLTIGSQMTVRIESVAGGTFSTPINGVFLATVTGTRTFTVPSTCTLAPTAGTGVYVILGNVAVNDSRNAVITALHAAGTGTYSYTNGTGLAVVDYSTMTGVPANSFAALGTVQLDPTTGNALALNTAVYPISAVTATTFTVNFGVNAFATGTGSVNILDPRTGIIPDALTTGYTVNIGTGKYANQSFGNINLDIANKALKDWSSNGNERFVRIPMIGGVRYDIQLDYYESNTYARNVLSWFSASQPKQVIPKERLYPSSVPQAPPTHVAPTYATALANGFFSYTVAGSNAGNVTISGNPAWLTYSNGILSGTPPAGTSGDFQITITIANAAGTGTSVLNLHVNANAGTVPRELWTGLANQTTPTVASIPTSAAANSTSSLPILPATGLEGPTNAGDNYGARIRGYITAPTTGNYYFWIAGNNAAELWISNDEEPNTAFKRAWLTAGSGTPRSWNVNATQKTPWLALEQGKKYYFEVLHRAGSSTQGVDNLAVGWSKPGEATNAPSEVVPAFALSPYVPPAPGSTPGTLFVATMLAENGAITKGVGTATMRLTEDESAVFVKFDIAGFTTAPFNGLTATMTDWHIHNDPFLTKPASIMYDPVAPPANSGLQPDGSHKWTIPVIVGTLSRAEVVELIKQGKAYINLHTAAYTAGEIRGNFTLANGTRTFSAPPAPQPWSDDGSTNEGAARFLGQATFGANTTDIAALKNLTATGGGGNNPPSRYEAWINDQFTKAPTSHLTETLARERADAFGPFDTSLAFNSWWKASITGADQLRQRVAFALSEIHVVSGQGPLEDNAVAISDFYDTLAATAFGNFRDILVNTTLTPAMGRYLDMLRNDKPDLAVGRIPNENYAREIKQLFSIGLYRMWPDGTLMLTSVDSPIDTYAQREIVGLSHVFTGWDYGYSGAPLTSIGGATADWTRPMRDVPARHFMGPKRVLNNEVLPGLATLGGQPLDAYANHISSQINDAAYQALPVQELNAVHDMLFNHPNTGPFICRQLIQRMVTSDPSRDYLYRVVQKFNDNGSGVRGDMQAVIKAVLLDYEARSPDMYRDNAPNKAKPSFGKQREPIMRVSNAVRAFRPSALAANYAQTTSNLITISGTNIGGVSTNHLLEGGNNVFLEFADTTVGGQPAPAAGSYTVVSVLSSTSYTVAAPGWLAGAYNQPANSSVMTITMGGHYVPGDNAGVSPAQVLPDENRGRVFFDFTSAPALNVAGFDQTVMKATSSNSYDTASGIGNISGTSFTIAGLSPTSASVRSGTVMIPRFGGSYQSTGRAGVITIDTANQNTSQFGTMADHGLSVGDKVFLNFTNSRDTTSFNETSTENDLEYTIASVPDANTFTVVARDAANAAISTDNQVVVFPYKSQPLNRNGTIVSRQGTFAMDYTDTDLQQTPLYSTTVFNFFLPGYKYAGTLQSQGITTPEFQLTSETTVVRQANFIYNGLFNPTSATTSLSSFKSGGNALVLDLSPWIGTTSVATSGVGLVLGGGVTTTLPWTSNVNLSTLVDRMSTLLLGGTLPPTAKTQILNFVGQRAIATISATNPCTVTVTGGHGFGPNGTVIDNVTLSGITGGIFVGTINATFISTATVTGANTFTVPVNCQSATGISYTNAVYGANPALPYNDGSQQNRRDRLRAIIHLILTSPDYTIQR